jgi:hypothetical protein
MRAISTCIFVAFFFSSSARSEDSYLLIGGGPTLDSSHVSMEKNAIWIQELLNGFSFASGETWYGMGVSEKPSVLYHAADESISKQWEPLARVFNKSESNNLRLRKSRIQSNMGPYTYRKVADALNSQVGSLKVKDSLFVIFSGHGSRSKGERYELNALRLLHDQKYTAKSFSEVLASVPEGSHVRFLLPQCYSGGFIRSVFRMPGHPTLSSLMPSVCGFVSVPETQISEGCTVGVNADDYRDYSTYFFSALAGHRRNGEALPVNPDIDHDGRVSLLEAHYYAFSEAQSSDLPTSTSEYVLELAQPWYARWLPRFEQSPDNPYVKVGRRLANRTAIDYEHAWTLLRVRMKLQSETDDLKDLMDEEGKVLRRLRLSILSRLSEVSKVVYKPLSESVTKSPPEEAQQAIDWIREQADYPHLVELQDKMESLKIAHLDIRRRLMQLEKMQRTKKLAILFDRIREIGTGQEKAAFKDLHQCESWSPPQNQDSVGTP